MTYTDKSAHKAKHIPRDLECGHRKWFLRIHLPRVNEDIWCSSCYAYVRATNDIAKEGYTVWDGYATTPTNDGKLLVQCNYDADCEATCTARSHRDAENWAFRHIATQHNTSSILGPPAAITRFNATEPEF